MTASNHLSKFIRLALPSTASVSKSAVDSSSAVLDLSAVLRAAQTLSSSMQLNELLQQLTQVILQNSGGDYCALLLPDEDSPDEGSHWQVKAVATSDATQLHSDALSNRDMLPMRLIQNVKRTLSPVVIDDCQSELPVVDDKLVQQQAKSVLCLPVLHQGCLIGLLLLRHQTMSGAFTENRLLILNFLCSQGVIALENARLHKIEQEKTEQLQISADYLEGLFQNAADPIFLLGEKGFIKWNQAAHKLFESPSQDIADIVHPAELSPEFQADGQKSADKALQMIHQAVENGSHVFEWQHKTFTDKVFWAEVVLTIAPNNGEMIIHSVVRDISDRKAAEAKVLQKSRELEQTLMQLQKSQAQVVQSEKMSALGNLVAGVAHEINNPIGFLNGSIRNAQDYTQELLEHLTLYQEHYPKPAEPIEDNAEEIDLDFISQDLPKLLNSMKGATDRIGLISTSLRTFSRADTEHKVTANLHEGIDSTLLILKYRLKANEQRPAIQIVQDYDKLPSLECFPGQLNQVFMNILANAIDVFDEVAGKSSYEQLEATPQIITIKTEALCEQKAISIAIGDNGKGMPEETKTKIFDHLFTTKAVGKGTGLGLAIAHQIVADNHGGSLSVTSEIGQGTTFFIHLPMTT